MTPDFEFVENTHAGRNMCFQDALIRHAQESTRETKGEHLLPQSPLPPVIANQQDLSTATL